MKILLTGVTGYIGKRLLPVLLQEGHEVVCALRDSDRFPFSDRVRKKVQLLEIDFLEADSLQSIPEDIEAAYYLIHSMSATADYIELERRCAINFREKMNHTQLQQTIYLTGMTNDDELSKHLLSRKMVEDELAKGQFALTALRAGIIIGSGSASFEIIRDLVEKLPIMVAPKWLKTRCQPIGIRDVLSFLIKSLGDKRLYNQNFDIAGPDVLTYREMLLTFAEVRGLKRWIFTVPVMTPRLSAYWLYFVTSTTYNLAKALVDSMKVEVVARDTELNEWLDIQPADYEESIRRAFKKIEAYDIGSSWKDAMISGRLQRDISDFIEVPKHGVFKDFRQQVVADEINTLNKIWAIGGQTGYYYATWLWKIRGYLDKLVGGVGLRRGRTNVNKINRGDAIDFWRVLFADKTEQRLLLYAEMRVPGDAWLEFKIEDGILHQQATFRPKGIFGRLYWYVVWPFHGFIFSNMLRRIADESPAPYTVNT
ncbi:MAG: SDR family oxidoreductase [Bacteroidota bacterium]